MWHGVRRNTQHFRIFAHSQSQNEKKREARNAKSQQKNKKKRMENKQKYEKQKQTQYTLHIARQASVQILANGKKTTSKKRRISFVSSIKRLIKRNYARIKRSINLIVLEFQMSWLPVLSFFFSHTVFAL